jgi:hypothetical protein
MRSLFRRVTLVLILSAVLVPGLAQAGPRVSATEPITEAFAFLWDALFGWVKNGAEVDPGWLGATPSTLPATLGTASSGTWLAMRIVTVVKRRSRVSASASSGQHTF